MIVSLRFFVFHVWLLAFLILILIRKAGNGIDFRLWSSIKRYFKKELTMRNNHNKDIGKITFPFESLFFILLLCFPISLLAQQPTKSMDVNDLLELSLASFESLPPYSMRIESELSFVIPQESIDAEFEVIEIRYDKRRIDKIAQQYDVKDKEKKLVWATRKIWTGEQLQSRQQSLGTGIVEDQHIDASGSYKDDTKNILISPYSGGYVSGFMIGDKEHVCNILKQSGVSKLYGKTEAIGDNTCYVVEGKTRSGTYKIWIDPNHGFNVRKAIVNKKIGDFYSNKPITAGNSDKKVMVECEMIMSDVEVEKVGDYYIPISATLVDKGKYSDGTTSHTNWSSKRSKIQLNPNFEEMGAFVMDGIPEGKRISMKDLPGLVYIWANGRFILDVGLDVIEVIDEATQQIISNGDVPPKLGSLNEIETKNGEPNTVGNTQANDLESQPEVLSEKSFSPVILLIPIGLLIIAVIGWQVFIRSKTQGN